MSEEQQLQIAKIIDKEVENKRLIAWGGFGVELYHTEIMLQIEAQEIVNKLIDPVSADQIQATESALALVKKEHSTQVEKRKSKTARFISVTKRLMQPEESIEEAIKINEAALLKTKIKQREAQKVKENKEKELKEIGAKVRIYVADMHEALLKTQSQLLADSYQYALDQNIAADKIQEYIDKVKTRVNVIACTTPHPSIRFQYNTKEDVDFEINKNFNPWSAEKYIEGFAVDIQNKYSEWALALKNKPRAAELNKEELKTTIEAIEDNTEKETVYAKLEAIATPVSEVATGKTIKEIYKLAEPETMEEAFVIINAFTVNKKICLPEVTKIKPINFGVKQMKAALEDVKNKDNNFSFTGLNFTLTEKL